MASPKDRLVSTVHLPADTEPWKAEGLCAQTDPESFFPEVGQTTREAKKTCFGCDVREQCLDYAIRTRQEFGIWGGTSPKDRRKVWRIIDARAAERQVA